MRKTILPLLLFAVLLLNSCTMAIKGLAQLAVKDYSDHKDVNVSNLQLIKDSEQTTFGHLFSGKVVYLTMWKGDIKKPPYGNDPKYSELVKRFSQYPDVVFANIFAGNDNVTASGTLQLAGDAQCACRPLFLNASSKGTSFIIGKDGSLLSFKGPRPTDDLMVDYVLYESRKGVPAKKSAKRLIRGLSRNSGFKKKEMREWYSHHFNKEPGKLSFSVSTP